MQHDALLVHIQDLIGSDTLACGTKSEEAAHIEEDLLCRRYELRRNGPQHDIVARSAVCPVCLQLEP